MMKKAIIALSGGIDSAVAAAIAKKEGYELYFLTCAYGQKNLKKEMENAKKLAEKMGVVEHKIVNMGWLGELGNSIITDKDINDKQNDHLIYVPYRNTVILSACIAWAEVLGAEAIFTGSEAGPWICPDNSPEYYEKLNELIKVSTKLVKNLKVYALLNYSNKEDDVRKGIELGVPFEYTWTCVTRDDLACAECQPCRNRINAFKKNKMVDPIPYALELDEFCDI